MQKSIKISLLFMLSLAAAAPGWAGPKFPKKPFTYLNGAQLLRTLPQGYTSTMRHSDAAMLRAFANSHLAYPTMKRLASQRNVPPSLQQLRNSSRIASFSDVTAQQPPMRGFFAFADIEFFMMSHDHRFPGPEDGVAFKNVLTILVLDKAKQIDPKVKKELRNFYRGTYREKPSVSLPARVEELDTWMKNTPRDEQLAIVQASLGEPEKPASVAAARPAKPQAAAAQSEGREPLATTYYSAQEALDRLYEIVSKAYGRRPYDGGKVEALPTPFGNVNDFWAVLSLIRADRAKALPASDKDIFLNWPNLELAEELANPDLVWQKVRTWQGTTSLMPTLPDPAAYPSAYTILKAKPAKKMEWKLAVEMWYLTQLLPKGKRPLWLENWDPYAKQPGGPKLATGHTDLRQHTAGHANRSANTSRPAQVRGSTLRQGEQPITSRDLSEVVWGMHFPYPGIFPTAKSEPENFLKVLYVLENWSRLGTDEQKIFKDKVRDSSLEVMGWTKEKFEEEIDDICREYNIEKTLSLPSVKDYPTVQAIKNADKGLKDLWSVLLALRTAQLVLPEKVDNELKALKLPFGKEPAKPVAAKPAADRSQARGPKTSFRDVNEALQVMQQLPEHPVFPDAEKDPEHFLAVIYLLEQVQANKLDEEQQEQFKNILSHTSLVATPWEKEYFDKYIDELCSKYNLEKTLSLPSVKDYPTVQAIKNVDEGLKDLWSILLAVRASQWAFAENVDDELMALELPFGKEAAKPVAAKPAAPQATAATTGKPQQADKPGWLDSGVIRWKSESKRTKEEQSYLSDFLQVFSYRGRHPRPDKNLSDFLALVRVLKLHSEDRLSSTDEQKLINTFSYNINLDEYGPDWLEGELKEMREEGITGPIYLPSSKLSAQDIESASEQQKWLWDWAARLYIGRLLHEKEGAREELFGKEFPEELQNMNVFEPEVPAQTTAAPSAAEPPIAHIGKPDPNYEAQDEDLRAVLMTHSWEDWADYAGNAGMFLDLNRYFRVIKNGLRGNLSESDLKQLYASFVHSPSNSIEHIQQELKAWQEQRNTTRMPDFSSYSPFKADQLEANMLQQGEMGALIRQSKEWCLSAKIALAQRIYGEENLPPELRGKVF